MTAGVGKSKGGQKAALKAVPKTRFLVPGPSSQTRYLALIISYLYFYYSLLLLSFISPASPCPRVPASFFLPNPGRMIFVVCFQ